MTVSDLMLALSTMPQDAEVIMDLEDYTEAIYSVSMPKSSKMKWKTQSEPSYIAMSAEELVSMWGDRTKQEDVEEMPVDVNAVWLNLRE